MAIYVKGNDFTRELCDALGIDWEQHHIRSVSVKSDCRDAVVATLEMVVQDHQASRVIELIRQYRLEAKP